MEPVRSDLIPDPALDRSEMLALQNRVRALADFADDGRLPERPAESALIAGVDQAFDGDEAVSAVVTMQDGAVVEQVHARTPLEFPYIPGLLAFRETGPIIEALARLSVVPDVLVCDGNGRIHQRQAGIATHVGVIFDLPTIGVAKNLLCGELQDPPPEPFEPGTTVPVVANSGVEAPDGTIIGYAVQTRQWTDRSRYINPVYASPGHRVSASTAAELTLAVCAGYKLPEPIRLADRLAGEYPT